MLPLALLASCARDGGPGGDGGSSDATATGTSGTTGGSGSGSGSGGSTTAATADGTDSGSTGPDTGSGVGGESDEDGGDDCSVFVGCPDVVDPCAEVINAEFCDTWAQNCPSNERCTPLQGCSESIEPIDGPWNFPICVLVGDAPPGSPCTEEPGPPGTNSCDATSTCVYFDGSDTGTCVELCVGPESRPTCPQTGNECVLVGGFGVCLPTACNPLLNDCPVGQQCAGLAPSFPAVERRFGCVPDKLDGQRGPGEDCSSFIVGCTHGHACVSRELYGSACGDPECCTPYCEVGVDACVAEGQSCVAVFPPDHPSYAVVGVCLVP